VVFLVDHSSPKTQIGRVIVHLRYNRDALFNNIQRI
jgi:hypothetical protein